MSSQLDNFQVTRNRISEQIANQIRALMASRKLKPGDRLPAERELAEQLGVSRSILREAVKLLEQQGLLTVQVGRGTFVANMEPENLSTSLAESLNIMMMMQQNTDEGNFHHFYEIRQMIERETAWIAAQRATEQDIASLASHLADMEKYADVDLEHFTLADTEYHKALAQATHNPLFVTLLLSITHLLRDIQRKASTRSGAPDDAVYYHRAILEAVRRHDAAESRQLMDGHLNSVLNWLTAADTAQDGES